MAERGVSGSVLVRFQSEYSRSEVVDRLRRQLNSLVEIQLPDCDVLLALQAPGAKTVSISGFERHAVRRQLHPLFLEMNLQRERIGGLEKLLIWWATPEIADQIAARIPDFESWFLFRLELSEDLADKGFDESKFGDKWWTTSDSTGTFDERMERVRLDQWRPGGDADQARFVKSLLGLLPQIQDKREREIRVDRLVAWSGLPGTVDAMILLSRAYRGVGRLEDAESLVRTAYAKAGSEAVSALDRADVYLEFGYVLMELGRLDDAEAMADRAVRLGRELIVGGPQNLRGTQSEALRILAWLQQRNGKSAEALGSLREAWQLLEEQAQSVPALWVQKELGGQLMSMGRSAEAVPILLAAAKAAGRWQGAIQFRVTLMAAAALRDQGRLREALAVMDEGLKLPADSPLLTIKSLELYIDILTVMGEQSRALEKARAASSLLLEQDPMWIETNWKACVSLLQTIALAEWKSGFLADALAAICKVDTLLPRHDAEINSIADNVAALYQMAAEIQVASGELDDALKWILRVPPSASRIEWAFSCAVRARVLQAKGLKDAVAEWLARAHKAMEEISQPSLRNHAMAGVYYHQSFAEERTEAVSWASKSLEAYQWLAVEFPERWRTRVAEAHVLLAERRRDAGMAAEAAAQYRRCLAFLGDDQSEFARKLRGQIESALSAA